MKAYFISLIITLIVECGLFLLLFKNKRKYFYIVLIFNLISHPALHLMLNYYAIYHNYWLWLVIGEITVVLYEGFCFSLTKLFELKKALFVSLLLNASSYAVGYLYYLLT